MRANQLSRFRFSRSEEIIDKAEYIKRDDRNTTIYIFNFDGCSTSLYRHYFFIDL